MLNVLLNNNYKLNTYDYKQLILSLENDLNYYMAIEYNKNEYHYRNNQVVIYCFDLIKDFNCESNNKFLFYEFLNCDVLAKRYNRSDINLFIKWDDSFDNNIEQFITDVVKHRSYYCTIVFRTQIYQYITFDDIDNLLEKFVFLRRIFKDRLRVEFRTINPLWKNEYYETYDINIDYYLYKYFIYLICETINLKLNILYNETKNESFNCEYDICDYMKLYDSEYIKKADKIETFLYDTKSPHYKQHINDLNRKIEKLYN